MHDNAPPSNRTLLRELNSAVENCALIQIIKMIPWWIISDRRRSLRALRAPALAQPPGKDTGGKLPPRYAHVLGRGPAVAGLSTAPRDGARGRAGGKRQTILGCSRARLNRLHQGIAGTSSRRSSHSPPPTERRSLAGNHPRCDSRSSGSMSLA